MSWYDRGVAQFRKKQDIKREEREQAKQFDPHRDIWNWYIGKNDAGEPKKLVILTGTDELLFADVHEVPKNGDFKKGSWTVTCPKQAGHTERCQICEQGNRSYPSYKCFITVLDVSGYQSRDKERMMPIKRLAIPTSMVDLLLDHAKEANNGELKGLAFTVTRNRDKGKSLGDRWICNGPQNLEDMAQRYKKSILPSASRFPKEWGFVKNYDAESDSDKQVVLKNMPFEVFMAPMDNDGIAKLTNIKLHTGSSPSQGSSSPQIDDSDGFPDAPF